MKSSTRTVLSPVNLLNASSYSSGPLDVGDLNVLALDVNVTQFGGGSNAAWFYVSRIGPDGQTYAIDSVQMNATAKLFSSIGAGLYANHIFGDQVQIDLVNPSNITLSATISLYGK